MGVRVANTHGVGNGVAIKGERRAVVAADRVAYAVRLGPVEEEYTAGIGYKLVRICVPDKGAGSNKGDTMGVGSLLRAARAIRGPAPKVLDTDRRTPMEHVGVNMSSH